MHVTDYLKALKIPLYFTSVAPVLIAWAIAGFPENYLVGIILIVVLTMQAALNVSMDYFDNRNGRNLRNEDTLFPLGSYFIERMGVKPIAIRFAFIMLTAVAVLMGLLVVYLTRNLYLLALGLTAVFLSLLYVIPPIRLGTRGVGEIATFFSFGPFPLLGTLLALKVNLNFNDAILAVSMGLLASAIRFLHHIPEDKAWGVRYGNFRTIFASFILIALIIELVNRSLIFVTLFPLACAVILVLAIPGDPIRASRYTNYTVGIHALFAILVILYFLI